MDQSFSLPEPGCVFGGRCESIFNQLTIPVSEYWVKGRQETFKDYQLEFRVHLMSLSSDDKQNMQLDFNYIPSPIVNDRLSFRFHLPKSMDIAYVSDFVMLRAFTYGRQLTNLFRFCQILENEKIFLVLVDRERIVIYLELLLAIDTAIRRNRPIKSLNRERLGHDILFAYEETKRTLAMCSSQRVRQCQWSESGRHLLL